MIAAVVIVSGVSENVQKPTANKKIAVDENVSKGNDGGKCRA